VESALQVFLWQFAPVAFSEAEFAAKLQPFAVMIPIHID